MNILILGGTIFLGKHIVIEALKRGHKVTLFNRGKHNPELFPEVEKIHGDRLTDLSKLGDRKFDSVIDTCGYFPRALKISTSFFRDNVPHYTFISSISVYKNLTEVGITEDSEVGTIEDENNEEYMSEAYGPLKRLCEKVVEDSYGDAGLNIRSGLIVGYDDLSDRFSYWPARTSLGGRMAVPEDFDMQVQYIDVKDLSSFTLDMVEKKAGGIYNVTGPESKKTFGELLSKCIEVTGVTPEFVKMNEEFLMKNEIAPYRDFPLWVPKDWSGTNSVSISKALNEGMRISPVENTIKDVLEYLSSREEKKLRSGLTPEREKSLIELFESEQT